MDEKIDPSKIALCFKRQWQKVVDTLEGVANNYNQL